MSVTVRNPHNTYAEQVVHYMVRPHTDIPTAPVLGAAAWTGPQLQDSPLWIHQITQDEIGQLERAADHVTANRTEMADLRPDDFPLGSLRETIAQWNEELRTGRGFLLVRGLPVADWGEQKSALIYWGIGQHLGIPGAQNPAGDLLGHVKDTGAEQENPNVRRYLTSGNIDFHCDGADIVGLLCLRKAKRGGHSRIVSSVAVYNELLKRRPDLAARLFEPVMIDRRDEQGPGEAPYSEVTPSQYADGRLRTFYHSEYFRSVERHAEARRFTPQERELFDTYEDIANDPAFYLDMDLEPGDIQFVSNHYLLHARTEYEDYEDPTQRRHLLRLWISLHDA